jgi:hypothetical protein
LYPFYFFLVIQQKNAQLLKRLVVKKKQKKLVAKRQLKRKQKRVVAQKNKNLGLTFW